LGFYSFMADTTKEDYIKMLKCLIAGYEKEIAYSDPNFSYPWFSTNFYSRAHVIIKISPECLEYLPDKENNKAILGKRISLNLDKETIDIINELSYQLIR